MTAPDVKASNFFWQISMNCLKQFCHIDPNQTKYLQRMNIGHDLTLAQTLQREHLIYIVHKPFKKWRNANILTDLWSWEASSVQFDSRELCVHPLYFMFTWTKCCTSPTLREYHSPRFSKNASHNKPATAV